MGELPWRVLTLGALAFAVAIFWPRSGPFWRWRRMARLAERVLVEDALKHVHESEYRNEPASVHSLAGLLQISSDRSAALIERIEARGLLARRGTGLRLTAAGRIYARRVIRVHRLWERYLAEETGIGETDWHSQAERREHLMSAEEANALAARMGHPRYDPHGDPIPTASGELPPWRGRPLTSLAAGQAAAIVHLEDEPSEIYSQLVAEDLQPGMSVRVLEATPGEVRFQADGREHALPPVVAANISVVPAEGRPAEERPPQTLADLDPGGRARVVRIARSCRGLQRRRLMDLGIVPGTVIRAEMRSASGDPTAYRVRGSLIALRDDQARQVQISPLEERP